MKMLKKVNLLLLLCFVFFTKNAESQMIDSVSVSKLDSIEYWHKFETKDKNIDYLTLGYFLYCNCNSDIEKPAKKTLNREGKIAEGYLKNNKKDSLWIYWNNVKHSCCQEVQVFQDSTIMYKDGKKIKKNDLYGSYVFQENGDFELIPICKNCDFELLIKCSENCNLISNDEVFKTISKNELEEELKKIVLGNYKIEKSKKKGS